MKMKEMGWGDGNEKRSVGTRPSGIKPTKHSGKENQFHPSSNFK